VDKSNTIQAFPEIKIFKVDNLMKMTKRTQTGFTLLEMILVLAIMASVLALITNYGSQRMNQFRRDRTAAQMQQILNAALSYYVSNGTWPVTCGTSITLSGSPLSLLQTKNYLPNQAVTSPWGAGAYTINCNNTTGIFTVATNVPTTTEANIMTGELPMVAITGSGPYTVTAQVNIPGQNLNNARSINFGSLYHHGACVPVPTCPAGMNPQIIVVPGAVAGVSTAPTDSSGNTNANCSSNIFNPNGTLSQGGSCTKITYYPINAFSAYATGGTSGVAATASGGPPTCNGADGSKPCYATVTQGGTTSITDGKPYWRVCLSVVTENGPVPLTGAAPNGSTNDLFWTESMGYVYATTRCTPNSATGEPSGSDFNGYYY
jgi:prepilin-type N-terminal cleavage/methylation domain-containing protein